ncbi:MAG: DUF308 domain-containing protein [Thermomicrobiales bacterium]
MSPESGYAVDGLRADSTLLTTRQVAELCQAATPTVVAAIRTWRVPTTSTPNDHLISFTDALALCNRLRGERDRQLVAAPQSTARLKRAGMGIVGIINFIASILSLITAFASEQFRTAAIALFLLNGILFVLGYFRSQGTSEMDASALNGSHRGMAVGQASTSFNWLGAASIATMIGAAGLAAIVYTDEDALAVKLSQSNAVPGEQVVVTGENFPPSSLVRMTFPDDSQRDIRVDEDGKFEWTFEVPEVSMGTYSIEVETRDGQVETRSIQISDTGEPTETIDAAPTDPPPVETVVPGGAPTTIPDEPPTSTATFTPPPSFTPTVTPTPTLTPTPTPTPTPSPTPCDVDGCPDGGSVPDFNLGEPAVDPDAPFTEAEMGSPATDSEENDNEVT